MERVLHYRGLATGGRQNELIELAITYGYQSLEIDMADLVSRHETLGKQFALQFLTSAQTKVGTFKLLIDFGATDEQYAKQLARLDTIAELAKALDCSLCYVEIDSGNDNLAFQENFEKHTARLVQVATQLEKSGIRIGLKMLSVASRKAKQFKFIETADQLLTMIRMCGNPNIGLCLDTGEWSVTGGTLEQITGLKADKIFEVRFSDSMLDEDGKQQFDLPAKMENSIASDVANHLKAIEYDSCISVPGVTALFAHKDRDAVVRDFQAVLNQIEQIIAGEKEAIEYAVPAAAEPDEVAEGEATEGETPREPAATV